jgi:hypothetical protein
MVEQEPIATIDEYKADLAEKRAMIIEARAEAETDAN